MTNISDTLAALKPCPFCGGEACCSPSAESNEPEKEDREPLAWGVGCSCTAFMGPWRTEAEAIAAWNNRTGQLVPVPSVEKVALALINHDQRKLDLPMVESLDDLRFEAYKREEIARATAVIAALKEGRCDA